MEELLRVIADPSDKRVPDVVRACLAALGSQLLSLKKQILNFDRMIMAWHRSNQTSKRLNCIPGVGPLLATALVANVADPKAFRSGRNFSAWIGLVPKQHARGRDRLGSISKQGDRYLCAACSWPAHSPSSAMPRSMAPSIDPGSQLCWHDGQPRSLPSRLPTSSPEWPGR
jgi:transposase